MIMKKFSDIFLVYVSTMIVYYWVYELADKMFVINIHLLVRKCEWRKEVDQDSYR